MHNPEGSSSYLNPQRGEEFRSQEKLNGFESLREIPFAGETKTNLAPQDNQGTLRSRLPDRLDRLSTRRGNYSQEALSQKRTSFYEEVFDQAGIGDIARTCRPFIDAIEFNKPKTWDILEAYERDYRKGNAIFVEQLSELFDIEPPKIIYRRAKRRGLAGAYSPDENKIYFYYRENRDRRGRPDDINTIAHEMWHAFQESVSIERDSQRGDLYRYNSNFYIDCSDDDEGYRTQLMEKEAFYFGDTMERKLRAMLWLGQDAQTRIARGKDVVTKFINSIGKRNG